MANPKIDFYLAENPQAMSHWQVACRLLGKIYQQQHQAYVLCKDQASAEHLDELLWTFRDDSFIPHNLIGEGPSQPPPIQLGWQPPPQHHRDILLLVATPLPEQYTRFKRALVVISDDPEERDAARGLYRELQQQGLELAFHKLA